MTVGKFSSRFVGAATSSVPGWHVLRMRRAGRWKHGESCQTTSPWRVQVLAMGSLVGAGGITWIGGSIADLDLRKDDVVWFGDRGPLSSDRSIAILPTCMCVCSGVAAAIIAKWHPHHLRHIAISPRVHEMLALPLSLLIAFRFQAAYDRWWTSRNNMADLAARTLSVSEYVAGSIQFQGDAESGTGEEGPTAAELEAVLLRARFLAVGESFLGFVEEKLHGLDFKPHPSNAVEHWPRAIESLRDWPEDAAACAAEKDPIVWCTTTMIAIVRRLQDIEIFDGDNGSMLAQSIMQLEQVLAACMVTVDQLSPAPFIVHLRTILITFCFTLPFALISAVPAALMIPVQFTISFAFLGSEYVSWEMEHPFGNAKSNIPVRQIVQETQLRIRQSRDQNFLS